MLMAESTVAFNGIEPVLIPSSCGIRTNHAGRWIDDLVPRVVLEGVVGLAAKISRQLTAAVCLTVGPAQTVVEDTLIAQCLVSELHEVLLVYQVVARQGTA